MPLSVSRSAPARVGSAQREAASAFAAQLESMTELFRGTRARPNQPSRYESAARSHEGSLLVSYYASWIEDPAVHGFLSIVSMLLTDSCRAFQDSELI